jgi:hypothetical protein
MYWQQQLTVLLRCYDYLLPTCTFLFMATYIPVLKRRWMVYHKELSPVYSSIGVTLECNRFISFELAPFTALVLWMVCHLHND